MGFNSKYKGKHRENNERNKIKVGLLGISSIVAISSGVITSVNAAGANTPNTVPPGYNSGTSLNGTSTNPIDTSGKIVTRYVATSEYKANIRTAATLMTPNTIYASVATGTKLTGYYNSTGYWFKITTGTYKDKWISAALLQDTNNSKSVNGNINPNAMTALPVVNINTDYSGKEIRYMNISAGTSFMNMDKAFYNQFKKHLTITESYRTRATQDYYYKLFGYPRAAYPGTSNHGFGNAIDFGMAGKGGTASPYYYGASYEKWLETNAWKWGFDRPYYLDKNGSNPEFWHYNFTG